MQWALCTNPENLHDAYPFWLQLDADIRFGIPVWIPDSDLACVLRGEFERNQKPSVMKYPVSRSIILALSIAGVAISTSCVVPYDSGETVTTYRTGYVTRSLPPGYHREVIGGVPYYRHNGIYYRRHTRPGEYIVVESPRRGGYSDFHVIRSLPPGYRMVRRNGNTYFHSGNSYYRRHGNGYVRVEVR